MAGLAERTVAGYLSHLRSYAARLDSWRLAGDRNARDPALFIHFLVDRWYNQEVVAGSLRSAKAAWVWCLDLCGVPPGKDATALVQRALIGLQRQEGTDRDVRRAAPLTADLISRYAANLAGGQAWAEAPLNHLLRAAALAVAHDAMLRAGELGMVTAAGCARTPAGIALTLGRTKTARLGERTLAVLTDLPADACAGGRRLLEALLSRADCPRDGLLFASVLGAKPASGLSALVQEAANLSNAPPTGGSQWSSHSCRAGGATDAFRCQVPETTIKLIGRWASDAVRLYIRTTPEVIVADIARRVASTRARPTRTTGQSQTRRTRPRLEKFPAAAAAAGAALAGPAPAPSAAQAGPPEEEASDDGDWLPDEDDDSDTD